MLSIEPNATPGRQPTSPAPIAATAIVISPNRTQWSLEKRIGPNFPPGGGARCRRGGDFAREQIALSRVINGTTAGDSPFLDDRIIGGAAAVFTCVNR